MAFDSELKDSILKQADIVRVISNYLTVTKKGRNYVAVCPFHDDSNPSLTISPEKKIFKCFVCGTSGNAFSFVSKYEHISYDDAIRKVAEICDIHDPRLEKQGPTKKIDEQTANMYKCLTDLTLYYQYALNTPEGKEGLTYFDNRNLDSEMRTKYRLGYAFTDGVATCKFLASKGHSQKTIEDIGIANISNGVQSDRNRGRVIFPICDKDGNVIGFSARRLKETDEAKYINSPETKLFNKSSILYNYHIAREKAKIKGHIYVVEGFMDVFALSKIGIDNAVAIMGTAFTQDHAAMLKNLNVEIRLCLDGDKPGQEAMFEISKTLARNGIKVRIVDNLGSSKDADEILNTEGPDALKAYLENLLERVDFVFNYYKRTNPLKTTEEKKRLVENFLPILLNTKSSLELDSYIKKLSSITGFEFESIHKLVEKSRTVPTPEAKKVIQDFKPERKLLRKLENAERELLYQMFNNEKAIDFYTSEVKYFFDDTYRKIANYIIDYIKKESKLDSSLLIEYIQEMNQTSSSSIIDEITNLLFESNHINKCDEKLLLSLKDTIFQERNKLETKETFKDLIRDKDPLDQARHLSDYIIRNKRK